MQTACIKVCERVFTCCVVCVCVCVFGAGNAELLWCADSLWHAVTITQPYLCSPSADSLRQPALLCPQLHHSLSALYLCVCVCVCVRMCASCMSGLDIFRILKCCRVCNLCCGNINMCFGASVFMSAHICTVRHQCPVWMFMCLWSPWIKNRAIFFF